MFSLFTLMLIKAKQQLCVFKQPKCELLQTSTQGLRLHWPLPPNDLFCYREMHNVLINGLTAEGFVIIMEIEKN